MSSKVEQLRAQLNERILVLDGGMGTMIQSYRLNEADFRGERFADWPCDLKGNNDLLVLSKPEVIAAIHNAYFEAGADIIETNTFNSTTIAMADYQMESCRRKSTLRRRNWRAPVLMSGPRAPRRNRATLPVFSAQPTARRLFLRTSTIRHFVISLLTGWWRLIESPPKRWWKVVRI